LRRFSVFVRLVLVVVSGVALSVSMELIQFYLPDRYTSMSDVYANGAGTLFGAAAAVMLRHKMRLSLVGIIEWHPFVALLIASWLGYRLFPFVPVIDLHKYWHAIQPLVLAPKLPPFDVYRHTVIWLGIGLMLERLFGLTRSRISIMLLATAVLFARIFIVEKVLSPAEVVGSVLAALVWFAVLSRARIRAVLLAALFATVVVIQALQPFQFSPPAHPFGWIPFLSLIKASPEAGVLSFFEKVFMYGSLIWLTVRAGCSLIVAATLGGALVLALKCAQVYLPDRSPEITDVIILLALAAIMKLMNEQPLKKSRVADAIAFGPKK
jgi:VanZ family protein